LLPIWVSYPVSIVCWGFAKSPEFPKNTGIFEKKGRGAVTARSQSQRT
jgi:hypothetical protein